MIKLGVSIGNLSGLDAALDDVIKIIDDNLEEVANIVYQEAKKTTAFRDKTGTLRRRIDVKKSRYEDGGYVVAARAPHAHLVEFGHVLIAWGKVTGKRVRKHPFMRPAKEKGLQKAIQLFK